MGASYTRALPTDPPTEGDFDVLIEHEDHNIHVAPAENDLWSYRDWPFPFHGIGILARQCSLRENMPKHYDAAAASSVATATATAIAYEAATLFRPSAACIEERMQDLSDRNDFRSAFKAIKQCGVCSEDAYGTPDEEDETTLSDTENSSLEYYRLTEFDIKKAICLGFPVLGMIQVYSPYVPEAPTLPAPDATPLGNHAIVIVGFDDDTKTYTFARNTTDGGYGTLAYDVSEKILHSLWMLRSTVYDPEMF